MVLVRLFGTLMRKLTDIETTLNSEALSVLGGFVPNAADSTPEGCKGLLLVGPAPGFWNWFQKSPEYLDGKPHPLDRWSRRVLNAMGKSLSAEALFPFGGPPYAPFISWALKSERCFSSPVGLLVHADHGLMVSYRGALAFDEPVELPQPAENPCETCEDQPCASACPVGMLTPSEYDTAGCRSYLRGPEGENCYNNGCLVRRACPKVGAQRPEAQSGFHMSAFQGG